MKLFPSGLIRWGIRLCLAGLILLLLFGAAFLRAPWWLDVSEPVIAVDAVLALGGGAEQRPFAAAAIHKKGLAKILLVPQTKAKTAQTEGLGENESVRYRRIWKSLGVPETDIEALPGAADSTRDEAKLLKTWLEAHPGTTVGIITHTCHTRRARMLFLRILGSQSNRVHFFGIPPDEFREDGWWKVPGFAPMMFFECLKLATQSVTG